MWKRLRDGTDARAALAGCGVFSLNSRALDPVVRGFIGDDIFRSLEELRQGDFF